MQSAAPKQDAPSQKFMPVFSLKLQSRPTEPVARESTLSELELVEGLLAGDARLAAVLYDHLRPAIDHALRRVLHARHRDFDDLKQTTFERILRSLAEGRFEGRSSLRTWASAIAAHVALDALRASFRERARHAVLPVDIAAPAAGKPEARLEAVHELERVQGILSRMKPDLVEALLLHDVLGHPLDEVAQLAGASPSATQSRLHRARIEWRRRSGVPEGKS